MRKMDEWLHMTDKRIPWSCMIYDWTEAGLGRTGKMHDRRLWTVTEGGNDFVRICFSPQYSRGRSSVASKGKQWEWNIQWPGGNTSFVA
jgi:hypothetical protein